jgi:hypothetical protein
MIWRRPSPHDWKRHFALWPRTFGDSDQRTTVWLEPYWTRMLPISEVRQLLGHDVFDWVEVVRVRDHLFYRQVWLGLASVMYTYFTPKPKLRVVQ